MPGRLLSFTLATVLSLLLPARIQAQALERVPPPIDIHVSPSSWAGPPADGQVFVPSGGSVRIYGTTVPMGTKGKDVRVEIKPPAGAVVALAAPIAADRSWATTFAATLPPGTYGVTAYSADGKNSAPASFTVLGGDDLDTIAASLEKALGAQAADAAAALANAEAALAAKAPYPEQAAVEQKLAETGAALKALPPRLAAARASLALLGAIAKQYPAGAGQLEPLTTAVQEGTAQAVQAAERMRQASAAVDNTLGVCDRIDAVSDLLSAASLWFDRQGLLFQNVVQLATDKYLPDRIYNAAVPAAKRDAAEHVALGESLKGVASAFNGAPSNGATDGAEGLVEFVKTPQHLLLDTTRILTGLAFDTVCERFTGPVTGTFTVDATINGGHRFWGYTTGLNGRITLMYEKPVARSGEPIPITGAIEGNGAFDMYEDLMALDEFNRPFVIDHALIPPTGTGAEAQGAIAPLGRVGRMATPGYFRVPVTGLLKGNELTITVGDVASNDFSDALKGRAIYVVLTPAAPAPYTLMSNIPIQKAQFILSRALRSTATLPVATATQGKTLVRTAAKSFDRKDVVSNGDVTVTWQLDVKACNPECQ